MNKFKLEFLLSFIIYIIGFSNFCLATENIIVSFQSSDKYIRILFNSKTQVNFSSVIDKDFLSIKFDKEVIISDNNLKSSIDAFKDITFKNQSDIFITLDNNNYKIRKFIGDKFYGIDILKPLNPDASSKPTIENKDQLDPQKKDDSQNQQKPTQQIQEVNKALDTSSEKPIDKIQESSSDKNLEVNNNSKGDIESSKNTDSNNTKPLSTAPTKNDNKKQIEPSVQNDIVVNKFEVKFAEDQNLKKMIFPWQENVASAVFYRSNYIWIVFDKNEIFDFSAIKKNMPEFLNIEQVDNDKFSIIRINTNKFFNISAYKESRSWVISVPKNPQLKSNIIKEYNTIYSKGNFFPAENVISKPIIINDPILGDQLVIVLFYDSNWLVDKMKHYVDFILLPTFQGFVINPISSSVRVNIIKPGIEVLSNKKNVAALPDSQYSILPYENVKNKEDIKSSINKLEYAIINSNPDDYSKLRFKLAKFYMNNNLNYEASGVFNLIDKTDKTFSKQKEFLILKAVTSYLIDRNKEAKSIFDSLNSEEISEYDKNEISFWNKANDLKLGKQNDFDYLASKSKFLSIYPDEVRLNFAFLDLANSWNNNNLDHVKDLLQDLSNENLSSNNRNLYNYYRGLYLEKKNRADDAIKLWQEIEGDVEDRRGRALAGFAIVKNLYESNKIDINEAIQRLNGMRNTWRGDEIELNILKYLASLYHQNNNYVETLRTWRLIANNFSNDSLFVTVEMSQLFNEIFGGGLIEKMTDFQAVSLFYEFRELTPIGKIGDEIIRNLTYKLINLDLLDKAEELLEHQINYRLNDKDDSKIKEINNLAFVYLLDKKPQKALDIYDNNSFENASEDELQKRKLIKAKAYIDLQKFDEALPLLVKEKGEDAQDLLLQIYFKTSDWGKAIDLLEAETVKSEYDLKVLTDHEKDNILKLAISYYMSHQSSMINSLYDNLKNKLNDEKLKSALIFLSQDQTNIDYKNLQLNLGLNNIETFLSNYKSNLTK